MRMSEPCFKEFTGVYDNKSRNERRFKDRKVLYIVKKRQVQQLLSNFFWSLFILLAYLFALCILFQNIVMHRSRTVSLWTNREAIQ